MRYRAELHKKSGDLVFKGERPVQTLDNFISSVNAWADAVLPTAEKGSFVRVYEMQEVPIKDIYSDAAILKAKA